MSTKNKSQATRMHQRMRQVCCQGSETTYPFPSEAAKATQPKASAVTSSTLPEFEGWSSVSRCLPSLVKFGVAGIGAGCMRNWQQTSVGNAGSMIAVDRSRSSSQLRVSAMVSRVIRLLFENQRL